MAFPESRMRRLRGSSGMRRLVRETTLSVDDVVAPLFVRTGTGVHNEIPSMPGVAQMSVDRLTEACRELESLGVPGVMGMLAGGLTSGFAVAIFMANAGGAWDNAKKYIETGKHGGKGSEAHKAGVVGDTVGDPFKDTSGPSLNILIKLMSMVSVVFAGLVVKYAPYIGDLLGLG